MTWLLTLAGGVLVLLALRDVFHTLYHPRGFGAISRSVFRAIWRASRMVSRTRWHTELAGPLGIIGAVTAWAALVVLGCALVYLPRMPEGFHFGSSLDPAESSDLLAAFHLSIVTVATLGFGDIVPADGWLRVMIPLQSLVGFVLLTAAISWVLLVYLALNRRRGFARRLDLLSETNAAEIVAKGVPCVASGVLDSVTDGVINVEIDLMQYGETYYFREREPEISLARSLLFLPPLVEAGRSSQSAEVRASAELLGCASHQLAHRLDRVYLHRDGSDVAIFEAFAADHQQPIGARGT